LGGRAADVLELAEGVTIEGVVLEGVTIEGVVLEGVALEGVALEGVTLETAPEVSFRSFCLSSAFSR